MFVKTLLLCKRFSMSNYCAKMFLIHELFYTYRSSKTILASIVEQVLAWIHLLSISYFLKLFLSHNNGFVLLLLCKKCTKLFFHKELCLTYEGWSLQGIMLSFFAHLGCKPCIVSLIQLNACVCCYFVYSVVSTVPLLPISFNIF